MEYQNTPEDDALFEKFDRERAEMLWKYYNLKESDANCPQNSYLLTPKYIHLQSVDFLDKTTIRLNIGYKRKWSGYVNPTVRMNYDQYIQGSIYCKDVSWYKEVKFKTPGTIKFPLFSKSKVVNFPVQNSHNIKIKCKEIYVEHLDIYVRNLDGKFILDKIHLEKLRDFSLKK